MLPGSGHTLDTLSRVAQEAEERAPEMRSLESAWRVGIPSAWPRQGRGGGVQGYMVAVRRAQVLPLASYFAPG